MKKNILLIVTLLVALIGLSKVNSSEVKAASWGAKQLYTTPVATRGTWYYKDGSEIKTWKITAHTSLGRKLYLPPKDYAKWSKKLMDISSTRKRIALVKHFNKTRWQAHSFKWHGIESFNTNSWLAGAGDGEYCVPVTKIRHGQKVKALRFGTGAGNWLDFYAYRSPELARLLAKF